MLKKEPEKKSFGGVFRKYHAGFSIPLSEGFANISFDEHEKMTVQFLGDEGQYLESPEMCIEDVQKVSAFIEELKTLRLEDYKA